MKFKLYIRAFFSKHPWLLFFSGVLGYALLFYISYIVWDTCLYQVIKKNKLGKVAQIKKIEKNISSVNSLMSLNAKKAIMKKDILNIGQITQDLRAVLSQDKELKIISLFQEPVEVKFAQQFFRKVNPSVRTVRVGNYAFNLKLYTSYPALLNLLAELDARKDIFWQSLSYKVLNYPNAIVDLKFYVLVKGG